MRNQENVVRLDAEARSEQQEVFRKGFAQRLHAALDRQRGIPRGHGRVIAVAELFGISQNSASAWLGGRMVPELWRLPEISEKLNATIDSLVRGDESTGAYLIDERYQSIQVHSEDSDESVSLYALPDSLRFMDLPSQAHFLMVKSTDMAATLSPGDIAIYDSRVHAISGNGVYVLRAKGRYFVRRIQQNLRGGISLICDNPSFAAESVNEADFTIDADDDNKIYVAGPVIGQIQIRR